MLVSQKLAVAAHLHVLLRRKTGRVTDTEWMAGNVEYAMEIVRFSRAKALEEGQPDLAEWAGKLERAVLEDPPAKRPLAQAAMELLKDRAGAPNAPAPADFAPSSAYPDSAFPDSGLERAKPPKPRAPGVPRYVGGIR
jgi:hypothetical protein